MDSGLSENNPSSEALYTYKKGKVTFTFGLLKILLATIVIVLVVGFSYYFFIQNKKPVSKPTPTENTKVATKSAAVAASPFFAGTVTNFKLNPAGDAASFDLDTSKNAPSGVKNSPLIGVIVGKDTPIKFLVPPTAASNSAKTLTFKDITNNTFLNITLKNSIGTANEIKKDNIKQIEAFINQ